MIVFCGPAIFDGDNKEFSTRPASEGTTPICSGSGSFQQDSSPEYCNDLLSPSLHPKAGLMVLQ